jgi:hypothetical protein
MPNKRCDPKAPQTRSECLDELNRLLHEQRLYKSELAAWSHGYPKGSALGLECLIAEYDRKIENLKTIFDRANQSSRPQGYRGEMKPAPAPNVPGNTDGERLDNAVSKMLGVPKSAFLKEEGSSGVCAHGRRA